MKTDLRPRCDLCNQGLVVEESISAGRCEPCRNEQEMARRGVTFGAEVGPLLPPMVYADVNATKDRITTRDPALSRLSGRCGSAACEPAPTPAQLQGAQEPRILWARDSRHDGAHAV